MKKIILTTAISALLSTAAFAGEVPGEIDFEGEIKNPSCKVALTGAADSFKVDLGLHDRSIFGPAPSAQGKLEDTVKSFSLVATGFQCDEATLKLEALDPAESTGVFYGENVENAEDKLAFFLENAKNSQAVELSIGNTAEVLKASKFKDPDTAESTSTYNFNSYLYNEGLYPTIGKYTTKVKFTVKNP